MTDIGEYIALLTSQLQAFFGERLRYIGLQGSCRRGEADEYSDIDAFVIIDGFSLTDADEYRRIISSMPDYSKSCGFISSTETLENWNRLEVCQLLHETQDIYGTLSELLPPYSEDDVRTYVKLSAGNILHEITHRRIHSSNAGNPESLRYAFKAAFYVLQNKYFLQSGEYILRKDGLLSKLTGNDREVLKTTLELKRGGEYDFEKAYGLLFDWCNETIRGK